MNLKRFGVSVEEDLLMALDGFVKKHNFPNIVLSVQHVHLDDHNCLETIALKGIKPGKLVTGGT